MTLKQVLEAIKSQAEAIAQVTQASLLESEEISNKNSANYPLVLVNSDTFSFNAIDNASSEDIYINVACLDRLRQDKSNLVDVYNWTHEIMKQVTSKITILAGYDITIQQNAQKVSDVAPDHTAGWVQQFLVKIPYLQDNC